MISVVVNTLNEGKNIRGCLESVKWADEIIIVDMYSDDQTVQLAREYTNRIFMHRRVGYVEPARNFALSKATGDWILMLDADERIPKGLAAKLRQIAKENPSEISAVSFPRKNVFFNKWIKHTGWWPDYKPRFFKKGKVLWSSKIHSGPKLVDGEELRLPAEEKYAINHLPISITRFISRINNYTIIEARTLKSEGEAFSLVKALKRSQKEFSTRYIRKQGYKDGIHGLLLSVFMFFYWLLTYIRLQRIESRKND